MRVSSTDKIKYFLYVKKQIVIACKEEVVIISIEHCSFKQCCYFLFLELKCAPIEADGKCAWGSHERM